MNTSSLIVPDESELVEFFGAEPIEKAVEDGYWCYEVSSTPDVLMRFSFNLYERSVQVELRTRNNVIATISHERATNICIDDKMLTCAFEGTNDTSKLTVNSEQAFRVNWSTLQTR